MSSRIIEDELLNDRKCFSNQNNRLIESWNRKGFYKESENM